jgi:chromate transporter
LLLVLFGLGAAAFGGPVGTGAIHGLKIVAVAVVAQAVWGMAQTLTPDRERAGIALAAVLIVVFLGGSAGQIIAIVMGGAAGLWLCRNLVVTSPSHLTFLLSRRVGAVALIIFFALLAGLPTASSLTSNHGLALFDAFYRSGAFVFGGGHVVLPLLETAVVRPGWISPDGFLAGYGAAQAVPGPLFTFAAYLGTAMEPWPNGLLGAVICLVAIFLPGLLLVTGTLPFWNAFRTRPFAQAAMRGTNAAVVGILASALYSPVWTNAISNPRDFAAALVGFVLLTVWKLPPWAVVILLALAGIGLAFV